MLRLSSYITIGEWEFDYCVNVEIEESIDTLTDICRITIPRRTSWNGKTIAIGDDPVIKRGDKVVVRLGYDDKLVTRFIGYVKEIEAGMPVKLVCEDSMFLLKRKPITKLYSSASLKDVLKDIVPVGMSYKVPGDNDIQLGQLRFNKATPAQILEELKSQYGLYAYFMTINEEPVLHVGLAYWTENRRLETFEFERNIISSDLIYKRSDDIRLKLVVNSWQRDNTKVQFDFGDEDGETRTVQYYNLNQAQCIIRAKADYERFKYTGYRGSFTTFGIPEVRKGDVANIIGNRYHPDGSYLIKTLKVSFGTTGYRQIIDPEGIINDKRNSENASAG